MAFRASKSAIIFGDYIFVRNYFRQDRVYSDPSREPFRDARITGAEGQLVMTTFWIKVIVSARVEAQASLPLLVL